MLSAPLQTALRDHWLESELGRYIYSRQEKLILDLVNPAAGESLLDVGCGTGDFLRLFQQKKCVLTGIDSSSEALEQARNRLGHRCELVHGHAVDLPFSDNEFDVVTIINSIQTSDDPQKIIAEAVRVSRGRIFVGFFNTLSLVGTKQSVRKLFGLTVTSAVHFFSIGEMQSIINQTLAASSMTWGSVIYLPSPLYGFFSKLEELFPMKNNPMGAFVGIAVPVRYTYRTVQNPIMNSFELDAKSQATAPEAIRGMLNESD
ncbi:MAG: class I SAM-dependent methyltransferase [Deltaproteobacteria bacterium]